MVYSLLGFIIVSALIIELAFIFAWKPVSVSWSLEQNCASLLLSFYANTITNTFADVALMVFVIQKVLPLQMPAKQKIILFGRCLPGYFDHNRRKCPPGPNCRAQ